MNQETAAKLAAITERLSKASDGPMYVVQVDHECGEYEPQYYALAIGPYEDDAADCFAWSVDVCDRNQDTASLNANFELMAHAWSDISTLLGIIDALTRERDEHEAEVNQLLSDTLSALRIAENDVARLTAERDKELAEHRNSVAYYENQLEIFRGHCDRLTAERDEIALRRSETVAMCEQLTAERDAAAAKERAEIVGMLRKEAREWTEDAEGKANRVDFHNAVGSNHRAAALSDMADELENDAIERGDCDAGKGAG